MQHCVVHHLGKVYPDIGNLTNAAVLYKSDVLEDMELGRGNLTSSSYETVPKI